jgi:hypothetical protein
LKLFFEKKTKGPTEFRWPPSPKTNLASLNFATAPKPRHRSEWPWCPLWLALCHQKFLSHFPFGHVGNGLENGSPTIFLCQALLHPLTPCMPCMPCEGGLLIAPAKHAPNWTKPTHLYQLFAYKSISWSSYFHFVHFTWIWSWTKDQNRLNRKVRNLFS